MKVIYDEKTNKAIIKFTKTEYSKSIPSENKGNEQNNL